MPDGGRFPSECAWGCPSFRQYLDKTTQIAHRLAETLYPLSVLQKGYDSSKKESTKSETKRIAVPKGIQRRLYRQHLIELRHVLFGSTPEFMDMKKTLYAQVNKDTVAAQVNGPEGDKIWEALERQGLSNEVINPTPEPVVPCTLEDLEPLLKHLNAHKGGGGYVSSTTRFTKGTITPDGRLDLCKQVVGPKGIDPLLESLVGTTGVDRLLLGNNIVGDDAGKSIASAIRNPACPLTTWYIAGNHLSAKGLKPICEALHDNKQVDQLWLKRNPVLPAGAKLISDLLTKNKTLTVLDLVNCGLLNEGLESVLDGLRHNTTMRHLYLGTNGITEDGGEMISSFLLDKKKQTKLHTLYLSCNRLGDKGALALVPGLRSDKYLKRLGLAANRIKHEGAKAIAEAVSDHPSLQKLDLGYVRSARAVSELGNRIEDKGAEALAQLIASNGTLRSIDCIHNRITEKGLAALRASLENNRTLTSLACVQFGIYNELTYERIKTLLARNRKAALAEGISSKDLDHVDQPQHLQDILSVYRMAK